MNNPGSAGTVRLVAVMSATVVTLTAVTSGGSAVGAAAGGTTRVSVSSSGLQSDVRSTRPAISADGRFVAFGSGARNLVPGDTNRLYDIFVHDRGTGTTERVSMGVGGGQADGASFSPAISPDGRHVAYSSYATNLVPGDRNDDSDVFVVDRLEDTTTRVTVSSTGVEGDKYSSQASLSADGRYVAFSSHASNLVAGDRNSSPDSFVHDLQERITVRVSVSSAGAEGSGNSHSPSISADGQVVAFFSSASNLVAGDTNALPDVFVRDAASATTTRVSVSTSGGQANGSSFGPSLSSDGRYVAFSSKARSLVPADRKSNDDVYLHDRATGALSQLSLTRSGGQTNGASKMPVIDASGRYVAYSSLANNIVAADTNGVSDVFLVDLREASVTRASVGAGGVQANGPSAAILDAGNATVSTTGAVGYYSDASNLVPADTNGVRDVFVSEGS